MRTPGIRDQALITADDRPLHQTSEPLTQVATFHPNWVERWYFNLQRDDGTLVGICGGGFYPQRSILEVYACLLVDGRQHNLRQQVIETDRERLGSSSSIDFGLLEPMGRWSAHARLPEFALEMEYVATNVPHLFPKFLVAADHVGAGGVTEIDSVQHFVQPGRAELCVSARGLSDQTSTVLSARDRTWGVRSRRPRLHNWHFYHLRDGSYLTLVHQERSDGSVMVSHLAWCSASGEHRSAVIDHHDMSFDPRTRMLRSAEFQAHDRDGQGVRVTVQGLGQGVRLVGAGYTNAQGQSGDAGATIQTEVWDLEDQELAAQLGRGTIDGSAAVQIEWPDVVGSDGIGVAETAIAMDHWRYGSQLKLSGPSA